MTGVKWNYFRALLKGRRKVPRWFPGVRLRVPSNFQPLFCEFVACYVLCRDGSLSQRRPANYAGDIIFHKTQIRAHLVLSLHKPLRWLFDSTGKRSGAGPRALRALWATCCSLIKYLLNSHCLHNGFKMIMKLIKDSHVYNSF